MDTGSVVYIPVRVTSGPFTAANVAYSRVEYLKTLLPHARHQMIDSGGRPDPAWFKFFQVFVDVFIGGAGAYTLSELINSIETVQGESAAQASKTANLAAVTAAAVQTLDATVQVVTDAGLSGAPQIPRVPRGILDI